MRFSFLISSFVNGLTIENEPLTAPAPIVGNLVQTQEKRINSDDIFYPVSTLEQLQGGCLWSIISKSLTHVYDLGCPWYGKYPQYREGDIVIKNYFECVMVLTHGWKFNHFGITLPLNLLWNYLSNWKKLFKLWRHFEVPRVFNFWLS